MSPSSSTLGVIHQLLTWTEFVHVVIIEWAFNKIIVLQKRHDSFGATELTEAEDWILGIQQVLTRIHNVSDKQDTNFRLETECRIFVYFNYISKSTSFIFQAISMAFHQGNVLCVKGAYGEPAFEELDEIFYIVKPNTIF